MFGRLFDFFRRRKRDHSPKHASAVRRMPPPPPPPAPLPAPAAAVTRIRPPPPPPAIAVPAEPFAPVSEPVEAAPEPVAATPEPEVEAHPLELAAQQLGDARVAFARRDGSVVTPQLDEETSARMDYVVRSLLKEDEPVRRTT
jgi:hypothetical protein